MSSFKRCLDWLESLEDDSDKPAAAEHDQHHDDTSRQDSALECSFTSTAAHPRPAKRRKKHRMSQMSYNKAADNNNPGEDELSGPKDIGSPTPRQANRHGAAAAGSSQPATPTKRASKQIRIPYERGEELRTSEKRKVTDDMVSISSTSSSKRSRASTDRSGRSTKQVRQMNQLAALQLPVRGEDFADCEFDQLPDAAKTLVRRLQSCHQLRHVVPTSLKPDLLKHDRNNELWKEDLPWIRSNNEWEQGLWGKEDQEPSLRDLRQIKDAARECEQRQDLEAGWNSLSHGPLLILAVSSSPHSERIEPVNITSAKLLPHVHGAHITAGLNKLVDFGIVLRPDEKIMNMYRDLHRRNEVLFPGYLNHTNSEQIAFRPLAISMETKKTHGDAADIQLRVWVTAHFHRLRELRSPRLPAAGKRTIILPLLSVFGPRWSYILAKAEFDDDNDEGQGKVVVYSEQPLGDVRRYDGLLSVLAGLVVLIDWAERVWRPWFEEWVGGET